jgi:cytosine/adenosine deaminase-related metal-dependent hydrolase
LILYRAAWVLPIAAPPVRDGWVLVDAGRILAAGAADSAPRDNALETIDLGAAAVLPGLVNAHTHLEVSWLRNQIPRSRSMPEWASQLVARMRAASEVPVGPIEDAVRDLRAAGTSLVGDVTNTLSPYDVLLHSDLSAAIFHEVLGFNAASPEQIVADAGARADGSSPSARLRVSVVPHAPYSVSPALFRAIGRALGDRPMSVHLGESAEELRFLRDGTGPWRDILGRLGVWNESWQPPGCGPVEYLERLGLLNSRLLAVHGTQLDDLELARLAGAKATVVTCPRSNRWTGAGIPPIERFYASGVRVAVGTDSLGSVEDLNLFAELAAVRRLAPAIPASRILASATIHGAAALGFGDEYGSIEAGKRADLIAVRISSSVEDVEEYLLRGVEPDRIRWLPV